MSILRDERRFKTGDELRKLKSSISSAVTSLLGYKQRIAAMKTELAADGDFDAEDVADVQSIIDHYTTETARL